MNRDASLPRDRTDSFPSPIHHVHLMRLSLAYSPVYPMVDQVEQAPLATLPAEYNVYMYG